MKIISLTDNRFEEFYFLCEQMVLESDFHSAVPDKEIIKLVVKGKNFIVFLAEENNVLVGFIAGMKQSYFFSNKEKVTDMGFYVKPENRGGRAAIKLLKELEIWAKNMGVEDVCISQFTAVNVEKTQKFFSHLGYKTVGFNTVKHLH